MANVYFKKTVYTSVFKKTWRIMELVGGDFCQHVLQIRHCDDYDNQEKEAIRQFKVFARRNKMFFAGEVPSIYRSYSC